MKRKICIITGTRAEYDLLKPLIKLFQEDGNYKLQLIVTCMHLSPEFGLTAKNIEEDQIPIADKLEMLLSSNTSSGVSKSVGIGIVSFSDSLRRLAPDILLVLGDRFEILSAVIPAFIMKIPVIHLHGGETTEGAFDEGIRHSITKMSYLHFTSTDEYRRRVIQLGENPTRVFNVGAIGVENVKKLQPLSKAELEEQLRFTFRKKNVMVTFHPATLESNSAEMQFSHLLDVLNEDKELGIIFTKANGDPNGTLINKMVDVFVKDNFSRSTALISMDQQKYLSTMRYVDAIVGNSSSGIIEAPSLRIGTINIGDRQLGRIKAKSIIDCPSDTNKIKKAFAKLFSNEFQLSLKNLINPYDGGKTSEKIFAIINNHLFHPDNLKKKFYDLAF